MFDILPFRRQRPQFVEELLDFPYQANWPELNHFSVDIKENDQAYLLQAEIPGVDKENININIENNYLTLSVQQDTRNEETRDNYVRKERRQFSTKRSFYLNNVDKTRVSAKYDKGILEVTLPKKELGMNGRRDINID